jgi:hypothetical protein
LEDNMVAKHVQGDAASALKARQKAERLEQFQDAPLTCAGGPQDLGKRPFRKVMDFVGRCIPRPVRQAVAIPTVILRGAVDPVTPKTKIQQAVVGLTLIAGVLGGAYFASGVRAEMKERGYSGVEAAIEVFQNRHGGMPAEIKARLEQRVASIQQEETSQVAFVSREQMEASNVTSADLQANAEAAVELAETFDLSGDIEGTLASLVGFGGPGGLEGVEYVPLPKARPDP